jgi:hypothetical protein
MSGNKATYRLSGNRLLTAQRVFTTGGSQLVLTPELHRGEDVHSIFVKASVGVAQVKGSPTDEWIDLIACGQTLEIDFNENLYPHFRGVGGNVTLDFQCAVFRKT